MKEKHLKELKHMIEESLNAHKMADWNSPAARKTIAELLVKKFTKYIEQQEELERLGLTEQDCTVPPNALGVSLKKWQQQN